MISGQEGNLGSLLGSHTGDLGGNLQVDFVNHKGLEGECLSRLDFGIPPPRLGLSNDLGDPFWLHGEMDFGSFR